MVKRRRAWWGAIVVTLITAAVVAIDSWDTSARRYWSRHSLTTNVAAGMLVLALTVLIIDRVILVRQLRNASHAIAVEAAIIVAQAARAADAIKRAPQSTEARADASHELRAYTQMLLTSTPMLIDTEPRRLFLDTAQRAAGHLVRAFRDTRDAQTIETLLGEAVNQLRAAAEPLLEVLHPELRAAVSPNEIDPPGR
jgi:hypothetical protein